MNDDSGKSQPRSVAKRGGTFSPYTIPLWQLLEDGTFGSRSCVAAHRLRQAGGQAFESRAWTTSLPATHPFGSFLEGPRQGVVPCPKQELATLRGACKDKLHRANKPSPALCKEFRKLLLPGQHIRLCEIVLTENPPNFPACKQVPWVVDGAQRLP